MMPSAGPGSGGPNASAFDHFASNYEKAMERGCAPSGETPQFYAAERARWCARRLGPLARMDTVLDFGCGVGGSFQHFFNTLGCTKVIGVDTSAESLRVAQDRHPDLNLQLSTPDAFTPSQDVGLAYCNGVFHHISPPERLGALSYIRSCMSEGALFAFWENNPWNPVVRYGMSMTEFDRDAQTISPMSAVRLLKSAGFRVLFVDFCFFFPRFARGLRPVEPLLSWLPLGAQYLVAARKDTL
jgi:trans-aconitate methyltransferase